MGFKIQIACADEGSVFTISTATAPIVTHCVPWTAASTTELWLEVEGVHLRISDSLTGNRFNAQPHEPDRLPWLAVVVHLTIASAGFTSSW